MMSYMDVIRMEVEGLYGSEVLRDLAEIISLYEIYEGEGQLWDVAPGLDYSPTQRRANFIKKLIKEEARFLFGREPEFRFAAADKEAAGKVSEFFQRVLSSNMFSAKLIKAARDCFIGKRVAVKLSVVDGEVRINFVPSMGFVYSVDEDDSDRLQSIVFFYGLNDEEDKREQRIWKQKYWMAVGRCYVNESIYDGYGMPVKVIYENVDTGLSFIPAKVVVNDGLSGDLKGESDVAELIESQMVYNRLASDDIDALRFNMFPQTVAVNASEDSLKGMVIAPAALIDLQKEITADGNCELYKLESQFSYDGRVENVLNRLKSDMYELLSVPNVTAGELKGYFNSGKSIKAIYWQLETRCEEKFASWRPFLEWMAMAVIKIAEQAGVLDAYVPEDLTVKCENVYPLLQDEIDEKQSDLAAVAAGVMSRRSYIRKWNPEMTEEEVDLEVVITNY